IRAVREAGKLTKEWRFYFASLRQRLADRNLRLTVLLVPDKYTVYGPLLENKPVDLGGERLLAAIEQELRQTDTPVVNLTQEFQASAAEALGRNEYIYWRDDTHWNPSGIKLAAASLWLKLKSAPIGANVNSD